MTLAQVIASALLGGVYADRWRFPRSMNYAEHDLLRIVYG